MREGKAAGGREAMTQSEHARYLKAKALVEWLDGQPEGARSEALEQACDGDALLRNEVLWQLQALSTGTDGPVGPLHSQPAPAPDYSGETAQALQTSGYRLIRRIGQGGMGVVYLAQREVGGATQTVALKLLDSAGAPSRSRLRRFESECRILASLGHANIARLLDAGRFADGRPFLAMEYVDGERIDLWCRNRRLGLAARLGLFLKVCDAVRHAHASLVIHRDIKPANILVDGSGEPKLLDFGIARLADQDGEPRADTATMAMTWAYASPEQLHNRPLGTASDVWQLGLVLYELVAGRRPLEHGDAPLQWTDAVTADRLPRPSQVADRANPAGCGRIHADVDAIVMKALRASPGERYASVADLMDDIERHLDGRPVHARRGQRWYRLRRGLWRQRRSVALLAAVLLLLTGFALDRQAHLRQAERARDRAQALLAFSRDLFESADPTRTRGRRLTVAELLDHGAARTVARDDLAADVKAAMLVSIARSYNALDLTDRAVPLLQQALRLWGEDADPGDLGTAWAALGRAQSLLLNYPAAHEAGSRAVELLQRAPGDHLHDILRVRINLLFGHLNERDIPTADVAAELDAILAQLEARLEPELTTQALAVRAMAHVMLGESDAGIAVADRALRQAQAMYGPQDPALIWFRFVSAVVRMRSDPAAATEAFRQQVRDYENILGEPTLNVGMLLSYLGHSLRTLGAHDDALQAYQRAELIVRDYRDIAPDAYVSVQASLARALDQAGRSDEAFSLLRSHMALARERAALGAPMAVRGHATALQLLADIASRRGDKTLAQRWEKERDALAGSFPTLLAAHQAPAQTAETVR